MGTGPTSLSVPLARPAALLALALASVFAMVGTASAQEAPDSTRRVIGAGAEMTATGLYRVDPSVGDPLLTHGPDARASVERDGPSAAGPDGIGFGPGSVERPPLCATDFYQQVIYANVSGTPDRTGEATAEIRSVIGRMDAVLNAASLASGGPNADYKVLCDPSGQVRVDTLTIPGASFSEVVSAARAAGFNSDRADYLVFVDGELGGSCGIASYETDQTLSVDNRSNVGGGYGIVYGPCWDGETAMHESAHLMGAVQYGAPNSTGTGGHCNEDYDVLCYSPDGGDRNQAGTLLHCPDFVQFDCGFDDYFDTAPEPGEYLSTHWNLGSPLNRFLSLSGSGSQLLPGKPAAIETLGKQRAASGERGDWRRFKVRVRGQTRSLRVRLFAAPGAELALFVRHSREPTREVFHCRDAGPGRHASCRISDPDPGVWYAGVLTRGGRIGASYKISARARR